MSEPEAEDNDIKRLLVDEQENQKDDEIKQQKGKQQKRKHKESNDVDADEKPKRKVLVRKYTANGTLPLHESVVIAQQPTFVCLANANGTQYFKYIEGKGDKDFYPPDTIDTQNPIPYSYETFEEFKEYIELAKNATFWQSVYSGPQVLCKICGRRGLLCGYLSC